MTARPWERAEGETARAHQAFTVYRDAGPDRSLAKVAATLGKALALIERWSVRWAWVYRVAAWDDDQERRRAVELAAARREATARHVSLATAAQERIATRLENLDPDTLTPGDLIRWLDVSVRLERLALGIPDRIEVPVHPNPVHERADLDGLSPEERRARLVVLRREVDTRLTEAPALPGSVDR